MDDEEGLGAQLELLENTPAEVAVLRLLDPDERFLPGRSPYADDDGAFILKAPIRQSVSRFFLPYGAVVPPFAGRYTLAVALVAADARICGLALFEGVSLPVPRPYHRARLVAPLVTLVMAVIRADGEVSREEIRHARTRLTEAFGLTQDDMSLMRDLMKAPVPTDLAPEIRKLIVRFPNELEEVCSFLLDLLIELAHTDGHVAQAEVEVIRRVVSELLPEASFSEAWKKIEQRLVGRSAAVGDARRQALAVLGVAEDATESDIKSAYHAKLKLYHPDKVANLGPEFQELANRKTRELNEAYASLRGSAVAEPRPVSPRRPTAQGTPPPPQAASEKTGPTSAGAPPVEPAPASASEWWRGRQVVTTMRWTRGSLGLRTKQRFRRIPITRDATAEEGANRHCFRLSGIRGTVSMEVVQGSEELLGTVEWEVDVGYPVDLEIMVEFDAQSRLSFAAQCADGRTVTFRHTAAPAQPPFPNQAQPRTDSERPPNTASAASPPQDGWWYGLRIATTSHWTRGDLGIRINGRTQWCQGLEEKKRYFFTLPEVNGPVSADLVQGTALSTGELLGTAKWSIGPGEPTSLWIMVEVDELSRIWFAAKCVDDRVIAFRYSGAPDQSTLRLPPRPPPATVTPREEQPPDWTGLGQETRMGLGAIGAAIGFFIGLPAGGIGAMPAAGIGFFLGAFFPEIGVGCLVLLVVVVALLVCIGSQI